LISNQQGVFIEVNQHALPHLAWTEGELGNVLALADEGGFFPQWLGDTPTAYSLMATLERLLPMVQVTELRLQVHFPTGITAD
jgi:hypothetical protein